MGNLENMIARPPIYHAAVILPLKRTSYFKLYFALSYDLDIQMCSDCMDIKQRTIYKNHLHQYKINAYEQVRSVKKRTKCRKRFSIY